MNSLARKVRKQWNGIGARKSEEKERGRERGCVCGEQEDTEKENQESVCGGGEQVDTEREN